MYTMGHWDGQPEIQWKSGPLCREPLHTGVLKEPRRAVNWDISELHRAVQEKEKRKREAAAEELDILGNGRDRKDML